MDQAHCPFCHLEQSRILLENEFAAAFPDGFPISDGHTLVVSKRHVASLFDLFEDEQAAVWMLVAQVRREPVHVAQDALALVHLGQKR